LTVFDRAGIAERLRGLIAAQGIADEAAVAARLGVEELSLRMSIDELSPHPTVEVLDAVIREYGVDPSWLLTGKYDSGSHRSAMESGGMAAVLREFRSSRPSPISEPPTEHFRVDDQN
jgi:hypothetical protein